MTNKLLNIFIAVFLLLVNSNPAFAELELRISKTSDDGIPIYLANIPGGANGIIEADLKRSGRFTVVDRTKIPDIAPYGETLNAGEYKNITDYIVRGKPANGGLEIELISTSDNATERNTQFHRILIHGASPTKLQIISMRRLHVKKAHLIPALPM